MENDPLATCPRRKKGQASCSSLTCSECESSLNFINLVSASNDAAVGAITHGLAKKSKLVDRHFVLATGHGIVGPDDIDWDEMYSSETGWLRVFTEIAQKNSQSEKLTPNF